MRKGTTAALIIAGAALILDSRCTALAVRESLDLCTRTLVPNLFPLLVVSAMLVPGLCSIRMRVLSYFLGFPSGSEGFWLLGLCGGFPVGAACISQSVENGVLQKQDAERMLGLGSLCGPAFLFGVLPQFLPMTDVLALFVIQMETSLFLAALWPGRSNAVVTSSVQSVSVPEAVTRAVNSMLSVCAWVTLAGIASGFLRRWLFSILPGITGVVLTGLLELTNGILMLPEEHRFVLSCLFVCFGGASVLLQIGAFAAAAGLGMKICILQKCTHAMLGTAAAVIYLHVGPLALLLIPGLLFVKKALEIPLYMVYNDRERKGSRCCFEKE